MTSDTRGLGFDYLYNHADRLATLKENALTVATSTHNNIGERVIKDVGGTVTHFVFDASDILIAEADDTGATTREYIHIGGLPVGVVFGTSLYLVHADQPRRCASLCSVGTLNIPRSAHSVQIGVAWRNRTEGNSERLKWT